jgi:predicted nucleic acid-binding Zn ribbon protein
MDRQTLAGLEKAIEPYRRSGFVVISQSEGSITLSPPAERFSYLLFFVTLVLFWPVAVIYLISFNSHKNRQVCVRVTAQGHIEETGYTFEVIAKERRRGRWLLLLLVIGIPALLAFALWLRFYLW